MTFHSCAVALVASAWLPACCLTPVSPIDAGVDAGAPQLDGGPDGGPDAGLGMAACNAVGGYCKAAGFCDGTILNAYDCGDGGAICCLPASDAGSISVCTIQSKSVPNGASNPEDPSLCCNAALGPSAWSPRFVLSQRLGAEYASHVLTADLNGDGFSDVAIVTLYSPSNVSVFMNRQGVLQDAVRYAISEHGGSIVAVDLDRDGILDLVASSGGVLNVLMGNGDGTFRPAVYYQGGSSVAGSLQSGDFNGDGVPDLVSDVESVLFLQGIGDGGFAPPVSVWDQLGAGSLVVADFNGDGVLDIAGAPDVAPYTDPEPIVILAGDGRGGFALASSYPVPFSNSSSALFALTATDIDGDGVQDLALASWAFGSGIAGVGVLFGLGDGTFSAWKSLATPQPPGYLIVAHPDPVGRRVVLFNSPTTNAQNLTEEVLYLFGTADGGSMQPVLRSPDVSNLYLEEATGDFNRDGAQDLLGVGTDGIAVFLNGCP